MQGRWRITLDPLLDNCSDGCSKCPATGKHVRTAMGVSGLRLNVPIVVNAVFEIRV